MEEKILSLLTDMASDIKEMKGDITGLKKNKKEWMLVLQVYK